MKQFHDLSSPEIASILISGGIGVLKTDTIYGVVAQASRKEAVERIYTLKGRDDNKSPIVLISSLEQLFDMPNSQLREILDHVWPDKISVIMPSIKAPDWITRGNHSVAYRMPNDSALTALIEQTGPLIAPSANPQGAEPATDIQRAGTYFGDAVDFYVDQGVVTDNIPSQILRMLPDGTTERLR